MKPYASVLPTDMRRLVWISGVLSLALLLGLAVYLLPLKPPLVALQLTFSAEAFEAILQAWKPEGVARFRSHLVVDYGLLLVYGVFGYLLSKHTGIFAASSLQTQRWAPWLMPLAGVSDFIENSMHWVLTGELRHGAPVLYAVAGSSATLKFVFLLVFAGLVARTRLKPSP